MNPPETLRPLPLQAEWPRCSRCGAIISRARWAKQRGLRAGPFTFVTPELICQPCHGALAPAQRDEWLAPRSWDD